ncbi:1-phosphofructokinase family hexose kinase [Naumannella halotolerans]|uniref:Carbohydrate kinase PfkB domain-containing protein n=1 Tax=Naumannella halotolerans TaxID=993414 RepID=A0A4R7J9R9_9ACTN|nr:hexose kinase [Naumannella halotolerans]TDT34280.1 hypothetical protein CLV29_1938 [Naumannella halotolerans]
MNRTHAPAGRDQFGGILTVTPNPALDITYQVRLVPGEVHRVEPPRRRAGGKGFNVARVVAANQHRAVAVAPVGQAQIAAFAEELRKAGVGAELVAVAADTRNSIALVDADADQVTVLNEPGSAPTTAEAEELDLRVRDCIARYAPAVVVIAGSLPPGTDSSLFAQFTRYAHDAGAPCIIDTSGSALLDAVRAGADLIKPNAEEAMQATDATDHLTAATALLQLSPNPRARALISRGPDGISLFTKGSEVVTTARPGERLSGNPTGAGDAAVAAAAVGLADGLDDHALVRLAVQWSSAAVLAPLAGDLGPLAEPESITVSTETLPHKII